MVFTESLPITGIYPVKKTAQNLTWKYGESGGVVKSGSVL